MPLVSEKVPPRRRMAKVSPWLMVHSGDGHGAGGHPNYHMWSRSNDPRWVGAPKASHIDGLSISPGIVTLSR